MKPRELEKLLKEHGWFFVREGRGSHRIYAHRTLPGHIVVAFHGHRDIPKGNLLATLKIMRGER